ncbi:MAG TPA: Wzt carbohydrate-binding domain-containing protein, partial [Chthoniobacteraceae bacterium]|nr:Wzt carbohydrate-binding domain-containing protein [Chthoniobacteraceae bacterium]
VLAVGDQSFQQKCLGKISEVARGGRTVLFVSHNAAAVENLCSRGIVLEHGQMIFSGTQTEAIQFYSKREDRIEIADLAERKDRSGTGEVRVTGMHFRDAKGEALSTAFAGQMLEIHIDFKNLSGQSFPNLVATLHVRTHFDAPVFVQQNRLTGDSFGALPEHGTLVCRLPRLPLPASVYRLGITLTSESRGGKVLDSLRHATDLPVETGDFFGTGNLPAVQSGVCLVDAEWRLESETAVARAGLS